MPGKTMVMSEMESSGFIVGSVVSCDYIFWKLSHERMVLLSRHAGGYFAEIRHGVFFWKLPGKTAYDVLVQLILEKACNIWKVCKYNPTVDTIMWHWFTLHSMLVFIGFCCHMSS